MTLLVGVSMTCTAFVVTSMTSTYRPSRENPRPWTSISPLYMAPSVSALVFRRTAPMGIVPSTVLVLGLITVTVLESWSAVYKRSLPEIGCARGSAGAWVTLGCGGPASRGPAPLAGDPAARQVTAATAATVVAPVQPRRRKAPDRAHTNPLQGAVSIELSRMRSRALNRIAIAIYLLSS